MAGTPATTDDKKFSHVFSGISVWLEPDPSQTSLLLNEMDFLAEKFGGRDSGVHRFLPHCTLLYNTSFPSAVRPIESRKMRRREGEDILRKCLTEYLRLDGRNSDRNEPPRIKLTPTSHYYFPYPKSADNGKGFGCAISLLMLETTPELILLQDVIQKSFPPDERHGGVGDEGGVKSEEKVEFRPHMTLIYAPENHEHVADGWLEEYTTSMDRARRFSHWVGPDDDISNPGDDDDEDISESRDGVVDAAEDASERRRDGRPRAMAGAWDARYISIWSTEGTLDEWFPIAKLDMYTTWSMDGIA
ncbi:hypothetical protein ACHAW5_005070 [Stephanodiscus triporus]|uniref:2',3'-cyclic-nucleotide 3'-phosphodiesterase n=1 Tax=Stephanodiscus triporus TaxID=2934178 RepID=A0ABD3NK22_9STRA